MYLSQDQYVSFGGHLYVPFLGRASAGPFLPPSPRFDEYLKVSSVLGIKDRFAGNKRTFRRGLFAVRFHGDSMTGDGIHHGDIGIFQQWDFEYIDSGKIVLIEKVGEEEGTGACAVKRVFIRHRRSHTPSGVSATTDWDDPIVELISSNPRIMAIELDPSGQYRVRGCLVRVLRPEDVELIDIADLRATLEQAGIPLKRTPRRPTQ